MRASFSPLGPLDVHEQLHAGALFDVFRVVRDGRSYALKTPTTGAKGSEPASFRTRATGIETSVWGGSTGRIQQLASSAWMAGAFLTLEAEKVRSTQGAWNHRIATLGFWDGPESSWRFSELERPERFRPALLMPFHEGTPLSDMPRSEQRKNFPLMVNALWRALVGRPHGDLSLSSLIMWPDRSRFVIIDPGVALWSGLHGHEEQLDAGILFTTNASMYPILPPTYVPPQGLEGVGSLLHHIEWLAAWEQTPLGPVLGTSPLTNPLPAEVEASMVAQILEGRPLRPQLQEQSGAPLPADLMAMGLLYLSILMEQSPPEGQTPLWISDFGEGADCSQYRELAEQYHERDSRVLREEMPDITEAEQELALAMMELRISTFAELLPLTLRACEAVTRL